MNGPSGRKNLAAGEVLPFVTVVCLSQADLEVRRTAKQKGAVKIEVAFFEHRPMPVAGARYSSMNGRTVAEAKRSAHFSQSYYPPTPEKDTRFRKKGDNRLSPITDPVANMDFWVAEPVYLDAVTVGGPKNKQ